MDSMFEQICDWDNLMLAARKAARGKRRHASAATFEHRLADNLVVLQRDLQAKRYQPGAYTNFVIHEPKRRVISAAPFRDRVVHHALCNVIEPLFEARFHPHSYANRKGFGTHRAIRQLQAWSRAHRYVLRLDVVEHFPSLDHDVLRTAIRRVIADADTLWLIDAILASGEGVLSGEYTPVYFSGDNLFAIGRPRGLPIGNLTSQFLSNVYMNALDWFITSELRCNAALRYVDDIALFANEKRQLYEWKRAVIDFLTDLRLTLHEAQAQVTPTHVGIPWLGWVVYPDRLRLKRRNAVNFSRRLAHMLGLYHAGDISFAELDASVQGWIAHVALGDTWGLRRHIFNAHPIPPKNAAEPGGSAAPDGAGALRAIQSAERRGSEC